MINQEHNIPSVCEFDAFTAAAVKACDRLDGVTDGVIGRPESCHWDPAALIGKKIECEGKVETISAADAAVVRKIWQGPKGLWYGLNRGGGFSGLANTQGGLANAFPVSNVWIQYFVKQQ